MMQLIKNLIKAFGDAILSGSYAVQFLASANYHPNSANIIPGDIDIVLAYKGASKHDIRLPRLSDTYKFAIDGQQYCFTTLQSTRGDLASITYTDANHSISVDVIRLTYVPATVIINDIKCIAPEPLLKIYHQGAEVCGLSPENAAKKQLSHELKTSILNDIINSQQEASSVKQQPEALLFDSPVKQQHGTLLFDSPVKQQHGTLSFDSPVKRQP